MASKSDKQIQLIVGTIREDMELTTRSYSTRNHYGGNQVKCGGLNISPRYLVEIYYSFLLTYSCSHEEN